MKNTTYKIKHFIAFYFLFAFTYYVQAQKPKEKQFSLVPQFAYTWQGTHNLSLGFQPMLLLDAKNDHSNLSLQVNANIMYKNAACYLTPITKIRIMPHKRRRFLHLAWFASLGHSYTQVLGKYDHRLTPELGIKWESLNLSLGYNIPLAKYQDNCTNMFRLSFNWNLF